LGHTFVVQKEVKAQSKSTHNLEEKSYEALSILFEINKRDTVLSQQIARAYILKALKNKDSSISQGYLLLAKTKTGIQSVPYIDSSFYFAKKFNNSTIITALYLLKADVLFESSAYVESLKNAILSYKEAKQKNNISMQIKALQKISAINELWGNNKQALNTEKFARKLLYKYPEIENFQELNIRSLEGLGKTYTKIGKSDSALFFFKKGIIESLKEKDSASYYAFVSRSGMALYTNKKYKQAIDSLLKGDKNRNNFNDSYFSYYYYYLGSSYYEKGDTLQGIKLLLKVDSVYKLKKILYPELPKAYERLVKYYKKTGNKNKEVAYLHKLINVERTINIKRNQITSKTISEYQIPDLLDEKEGIIEDLNLKNNQKRNLILGVLFLLFASIIFGGYYFRRQKIFKKRFEQIIQSQTQEQENKKDATENKKNENVGFVSSDKIQEILEKLEQFEQNKAYLNPEISLSVLAKQMDTNTTYLSKVINLEKDTNFSGYINNLRVAYAVKELTQNKKFRKYTVKAIANEIGFKNTESFSKAFYKKYGIFPSFFIKQLDTKD
jgi:AraC-like DNA-binding protein